MNAFTLLPLLLSVVIAGPSTKRLTDSEKGHYYALKVWMDKAERKAYLKLKTQDARDGWLKANPADCERPCKKYWERFYQYDDDERRAIVAGEVTEGFTDDKVLMAWGMPHERKRLTGRPATRSEMYVYRFEVDWEGYVTVWQPGSKTAHKAVDLYRMEVYVDDRQVTEMVKKKGWQ